MFEQVVSSMIPSVVVLGYFGVMYLSSRRALAKQRIAAQEALRDIPWNQASPATATNTSSADVLYGAEEVRYGFFGISYYSRRFLVRVGAHHFLVIVTSDNPKPYIQFLDSKRATLVSRSIEWTARVSHSNV